MRSVVIVSGAGISAESGIRTFRDGDGLWHEHDIMEVCSDIGFRMNRSKVLRFYDERRSDLADKEPNAAHRMIDELQKEFPDRIINITQNIDDLFEKAGCTNVVHLHGELTKIVCQSCGHIEMIGYRSITEMPLCPACHMGRMRHYVVMFGEKAPLYATLYDALESAEMLVVIGTSGQVLPVDSFAQMVPYSILNNLEQSDDLDDSCFSTVIYKKATDAAPEIAEHVRSFLAAH